MHNEQCIMNNEWWIHPLSSEALGSCHPGLDPSSSWTWFRTDVCRNVDSLRVNSSVLNRVQDDESSLGWRIEFRMTNQVWDELPSTSLKWGWVPIIIPNPHILNHINTDFELWNTFQRMSIMHYIMFACVCVRGAEPFEPILRWLR